MPKNKDFKRIVRARMKKSGESYTAARRQLLKKSAPRTAAETSAAPVRSARSSEATGERIALAGMSDDAVKAKTGKTWREWVRVLDAAGARQLAHREIANHLRNDGGLPGWWAQMVAVGYERITGLREVGQQRGGGASAGTYSASKSRTYPVAVAQLFRAFRDSKVRARWFDSEGLTIRKATPSRSIRCKLDGASVDVMFFAKGRAKSVVQIDHQGLPTKTAMDAAKRSWHERLDALGALLREE